MFVVVTVAEGWKPRAGYSDFGVKHNDPWTTLIMLIFRLRKRTWHWSIKPQLKATRSCRPSCLGPPPPKIWTKKRPVQSECRSKLRHFRYFVCLRPLTPRINIAHLSHGGEPWRISRGWRWVQLEGKAKQKAMNDWLERKVYHRNFIGYCARKSYEKLIFIQLPNVTAQLMSVNKLVQDSTASENRNRSLIYTWYSLACT